MKTVGTAPSNALQGIKTSKPSQFQIQNNGMAWMRAF
uniref:Uncharacterized protein n=1 Tax=Setaria viridis TaxID=4556 RepID=A0A4V6D525_SETVI|nr:hypothetical protein SEVIR_6G042050v2 [Setaria viridis]